MIKYIFKYCICLLLFFYFVFGCSKVRESAGVTRKSPDEFQTIENPPLIIPPDYSLIPPEQLKERNIENIEAELAQEILYGLDEENIKNAKQLSTMNKILFNAGADSVSDTIREEIDVELSQIIETEDEGFLFQWSTEQEVLDAVKESERIRESNFNNESISEGETPIIKQKIKRKKKKRFIFF